MSVREFNFNELQRQFSMMRKMGDVRKIVKMIPGLAQALGPDSSNTVSHKQVGRLEAIILAMTPMERENPDLLDGPRKARIARGSGTSMDEVSQLVYQVFQIRRNWWSPPGR